MKVTILTIGTRGDVQPLVALGLGLKQAGYEVKIVTHSIFDSWIRSYGFNFAAIEGDPIGFLESEQGKQILESGSNPIEFIRLFSQTISPFIDRLMSDIWQACQSTDALAALEKTNQRGIIATGWVGINNVDLPDSVIAVNSVPHDWLFPKCAAVVHHGGAGTTAAGLKAGVPTIIVPFFSDQPFWGQRIAELGVGTEPIAQKELTVEKLSAAIDDIFNNPQISDRANRLGKQISSENNVKNAAKAIGNYI